MSECLHCGSCCKEMCPITGDGTPCPYLVERDGMVFCGIYDDRPKQCADHCFRGHRYCPIGLSVLKPSSPSCIHRRIDAEYAITKELIL